MKLILHVGLPKTATTSIQSFIRQNRETLIAREKIFSRPRSAPDGTQNSDLRIAAGLLGFTPKFAGTKFDYRSDKPPGKILEEWIEGARSSGCDTILLTAEQFGKATSAKRSRRDKAGIDAFAFLNQLFSSVTVIMSVRRQDLWFESRYNRYLYPPTRTTPEGKIRSIDELLSVFERTKGMDYLYQADRWASVFGRENIIIIPFEREQIEISPTVNFFRSVNVDVTGNEYDRSEAVTNISLSLNSHAVIGLFRDNELPYPGDDHRPYFKLATKLLKFERQFSYDNTYKKFLRTEDAVKLLQLYARSNAELAQTYLGRDDGRLFYNNEVSDEGRYDGEQLLTQNDIERLYSAGIFEGIEGEIASIINSSSDLPNVPKN